MSTAYLDGDVIAYRAAVLNQENIDWGEDEGEHDPESLTTNLPGALESADYMVRSWTSKAGARTPFIAFSPRERHKNFRRLIDPSYKANRKGAKPVLYNAVRDHMEENYQHLSIDWLEGDDVIGICITRFPGVAVSIDKDMRTLPGHHFNPDKDTRATKVTRGRADYNWMYQTLVGDTTDGYVGCKGCGAKGAEKLLNPLPLRIEAMWPAVVERFGSEAKALHQARLARILRHGEFDQGTGVVKLWHPRKPTYLNTQETPDE